MEVAELERRTKGFRGKYGGEGWREGFRDRWDAFGLDGRRARIEKAKELVMLEAFAVGVHPEILKGCCHEIDGSDAWKELESAASVESLIDGALSPSAEAVVGGSVADASGAELKAKFVREAVRATSAGKRMSSEEEDALSAFQGSLWDSWRAYFLCCFAIALLKSSTPTPTKGEAPPPS
ncbi:hypothetical protein HOP50_01g09780 [Chloropicon primus]|uniref:Uncharacterized protein n=1 Tax=Chloropicon primus TaxID=1764295 RepID=A0A5B8ME75_9CHLO|nr:hypothetical protein A3770_01p09920 [Chloropicon primus]UPQ97683.1 hypothetical protein HOP50_01g09780 [Chloropicon primus]|eukprot:QDZ18474.1 hypothetical protein A3770_01p09920 [Chloropicon primus]